MELVHLLHLCAFRPTSSTALGQRQFQFVKRNRKTAQRSEGGSSHMIMGQLMATKMKCSSTAETMMRTMFLKACCMRRSCAEHSCIHTITSSAPLFSRLIVTLWLDTQRATGFTRSLIACRGNNDSSWMSQMHCCLLRSNCNRRQNHLSKQKCTATQ